MSHPRPRTSVRGAITFDTYLDPGTVVHTVTTSGPPAASFTLTGVDGLTIDNAGVISVTDVAAFGPFGTSVVATVTAATAEGASSSELINITRLTATDPNIEWQVMQTYDVFWEHGDSGWPEQFAATGPVAAEVHQVCIDGAQRLNDEPQDLPFPWSEPEIVVYGYYTFTTGTGNAACNGTKLQTFTQYDWFYNTTSSTDELWWQAEAPLRTGTYNGGDIQNAQYSGMPYIY